ncbi:MAG: fibronectin type III domain-containing protein, partial [Chitinophagales bacterium]|nr:fibronectin type III domain-containing protein [Chitinophagales bacterium]
MKRGISFGIIATICLLFIAIPNARSTHFSGVYQLFDCGQVENLTASTIGYNTATIQWEPAPGAVAYNVRIAADGQETIINIIEGNTYTFENLLPNTTYTVTITAMCLVEGNLVSSIISVQYTFTTESEPTPSCGLPSKPAVNRITDNSAIVSWFADPNAIGYNLVYYAKETVPTQITLEGTSYELLFLTPNTEYTVEIYSICNLDSVPTQNDQGTTITFTTEGTQLNCQPNAYEANNSIATASRMSIDNIGIDAMIEAPKSETKDLDYYSFVAPARGSFLVAKLKNLTKNYNLSIFNADGIL